MESIPTQNMRSEKGTEQTQAKVTQADVSLGGRGF